ncbi:hypothetical protein PR202_gb11762 [Eleusine coracana subsp. coracana]|uniref:Uncharacterized protein n=1 Tax=Eleusine coracana subsp. coracana TaxID=191504 RepID=A0AAV5ENB9_ELECO|nr:hypothetical protein PR202_gb11762 [Eleusine coracana subsp. coracana]
MEWCDFTPEQGVELAELVKNIQPEFPVHVAQMKKSNVKRHGASLVICKRYAVEHFPAESGIITLEGPGGKQWLVSICLFGSVSADVKSFLGGKSPSSNQHGRKEPHVSLDNGGPSHPPSYVVLGSTKLTPAQEKVVAEKVEAIGSELPIFVATVTKKIAGDNGSYSIISFLSDFDAQYAAPHLPDGKQTLMLHQTEWSKAWRIMLRNRQMLPGELREFARDNRLWTGDLCLFEPMKIKKVAMMVHIIRGEQYC